MPATKENPWNTPWRIQDFGNGPIIVTAHSGAQVVLSAESGGLMCRDAETGWLERLDADSPLLQLFLHAPAMYQLLRDTADHAMNTAQGEALPEDFFARARKIFAAILLPAPSTQHSSAPVPPFKVLAPGEPSEERAKEGV